VQSRVFLIVQTFHYTTRYFKQNDFKTPLWRNHMH